MADHLVSTHDAAATENRLIRLEAAQRELLEHMRWLRATLEPLTAMIPPAMRKASQ